MRLKEELENLVKQFELDNGIINKLVDQTYEAILLILKNEATKGKKSTRVPIQFEGMSGGNYDYFNTVKSKIISKLQSEGLTCHDDDGSFIYVSWI